MTISIFSLLCSSTVNAQSAEDYFNAIANSSNALSALVSVTGLTITGAAALDAQSDAAVWRDNFSKIKSSFRELEYQNTQIIDTIRQDQERNFSVRVAGIIGQLNDLVEIALQDNFEGFSEFQKERYNSARVDFSRLASEALEIQRNHSYGNNLIEKLGLISSYLVIQYKVDTIIGSSDNPYYLKELGKIKRAAEIYISKDSKIAGEIEYFHNKYDSAFIKYSTPPNNFLSININSEGSRTVNSCLMYNVRYNLVGSEPQHRCPFTEEEANKAYNAMRPTRPWLLMPTVSSYRSCNKGQSFALAESPSAFKDYISNVELFTFNGKLVPTFDIIEYEFSFHRKQYGLFEHFSTEPKIKIKDSKTVSISNGVASENMEDWFTGSYANISYDDYNQNGLRCLVDFDYHTSFEKNDGYHSLDQPTRYTEIEGFPYDKSELEVSKFGRSFVYNPLNDEGYSHIHSEPYAYIKKIYDGITTHESDEYISLMNSYMFANNIILSMENFSIVLSRS